MQFESLRFVLFKLEAWLQVPANVFLDLSLATSLIPATNSQILGMLIEEVEVIQGILTIAS